jgi:hypothetical protein
MMKVQVFKIAIRNKKIQSQVIKIKMFKPLDNRCSRRFQRYMSNYKANK